MLDAEKPGGRGASKRVRGRTDGGHVARGAVAFNEVEGGLRHVGREPVLREGFPHALQMRPAKPGEPLHLGCHKFVDIKAPGDVIGVKLTNGSKDRFKP